MNNPESLYLHSEDVHNTKTPKIIIPLILDKLHVSSVLDIGCGTGTWLKIFHSNGIDDILGVDGHYVNKDLLKIESIHFIAHDLRTKFLINRKFDLVLSLEVAEHIPADSAKTFVESLISHGNSIIFSAAIPGQGGQNHVNEQWPDYWMEKFATHGYYFHDVIRPLIWDNPEVEWWYKQNMFLVTKEKNADNKFKSFVHPDLFKLINDNRDEYQNSLLQGKQGLRQAFKILFNALLFKLSSYRR